MTKFRKYLSRPFQLLEYQWREGRFDFINQLLARMPPSVYDWCSLNGIGCRLRRSHFRNFVTSVAENSPYLKYDKSSISTKIFGFLLFPWTVWDQLKSGEDKNWPSWAFLGIPAFSSFSQQLLKITKLVKWGKGFETRVRESVQALIGYTSVQKQFSAITSLR